MTDIDQKSLETLAAELGDYLLAAGEMLVTAESCTGGWVAQCVTAISGSSVWFDRGFVTYSNDAKTEMLGVPADMLAEHGAVSEPVAVAMAQGALIRSRAQWSLAISGVAGPTGGTVAKPVGTVCFAWAASDGGGMAETCHFQGDRESVRAQSVRHALAVLLARFRREDWGSRFA